MGIIGGFFISISTMALQTASVIFEILLTTTVIQFGATLTDYGILDGIRLVWSAFRDIANILIIGMFVFVAISMILGNEHYGTKKFVAKILTVAVLINFSLLFTQLVVDASHIATNQFYRGVRAAAMSSSPAFSEVSQSGVSQAIDDMWNRQGGVAGAFMNKLGVSSFMDSANVVAKVSDSESNWVSAVGLSIFFSLLVMVVVIATAAVFLYGAYLLTARALLLIVLLATSSLAFAAMIIPKYGEGEYGWDGWLKALIQNAVLAPFLMMMLWASLVILSKAPTGSMGEFLSNPTQPGVGATIVVYLFTIGMLYLSFKISSSFSQKITGFKLAGVAANWPFGAAGRLILGAPAKSMLTGRLSKVGYTLQTAGQQKVSSLYTPRGLAQALTKYGAQAGTQALRTAQTSSFSPGRLPQALDEKYKNLEKQFGKDMGKGGAVEAAKLTDARKKAAEEQNVAEIEAQTANASKKPRAAAEAEAKTAILANDRKKEGDMVEVLKKQQSAATALQAKHEEALTQIKEAIAKGPTGGMPNFALEEQRKRAEKALETVQGEIKAVGERLVEAERSQLKVSQEEVETKMKSLELERKNNEIKKVFSNNPEALRKFFETKSKLAKSKDIQQLAKALEGEKPKSEKPDPKKSEPPPSKDSGDHH